MNTQNKQRTSAQNQLRLLAITLALLATTSACHHSDTHNLQDLEVKTETIQTKPHDQQNMQQAAQKKQRAELTRRSQAKAKLSAISSPQNGAYQDTIMTIATPDFHSPNDLPSLQVELDNENYLSTLANPIKQVAVDPVSTFSIDVDTGSYSNSRRLLNNGQLPASDAIREEAFINYFDYNYPAPKNTALPFNVHTEMANAPWHKQRQLLKIGIKGFEIEKTDIKAANLVFLLDVSGSMNAPDKLPLLKTSLTMLTKQLDADDSVAIVVYAGAAGVVLPATAGNDHLAITTALQQLSAGGATNGAQGIELAYQIAQQNFKEQGVNRVILATDGDFNVGLQSIDKLKALIAKKRETGIALTTLGFGQGNYNDGLMEQLANVGNGQHAYIDTLNEARKVLVDELSSTLQIIAKDVKIQVEFNPLQVAEYRLIGYQNRLLANEDFNNDKVDAAELGAGHTVTALYEITLVGSDNKQIDELRYQHKKSLVSQPTSSQDEELAFVKIRYKQLGSNDSQLITQAVMMPTTKTEASSDFKFASAVAGFAQLLKGAKYTGQWQYKDCADLATQNRGDDPFGYRAEFIQLVRTADALQ